MEENLIKEIFNFQVKLTHPTILAAKKKYKVFNGTFCLIAGLLFAALGVVSYTTSNNPSLPVMLIFMGFGLFGVISAIYFFATIKPKENDKNLSCEYRFTEIGLIVNQNNEFTNKSKNLTNCLYVSYQNKQFISQIIESNSNLLIKVYTGTVNMVPQYKKYNLPKDVVGVENIENLRTFLIQQIGKNYIIKNS